jgi:hypothetical protein
MKNRRTYSNGTRSSQGHWETVCKGKQNHTAYSKQHPETERIGLGIFVCNAPYDWLKKRRSDLKSKHDQTNLRIIQMLRLFNHREHGLQNSLDQVIQQMTKSYCK